MYEQPDIVGMTFDCVNVALLHASTARVVMAAPWFREVAMKIVEGAPFCNHPKVLAAAAAGGDFGFDALSLSRSNTFIDSISTSTQTARVTLVCLVLIGVAYKCRLHVETRRLGRCRRRNQRMRRRVLHGRRLRGR